MNEIKISEAITLEPGKTYVIEVDHRLSTEQREYLVNYIGESMKLTGCKFVVLGGGVRLAKSMDEDTLYQRIEDNFGIRRNPH